MRGEGEGGWGKEAGRELICPSRACVAGVAHVTQKDIK